MAIRALQFCRSATRVVSLERCYSTGVGAPRQRYSMHCGGSQAEAALKSSHY